MPRPKKCRRICDYPQTPSFIPAEMPEPMDAVILTLEEYETIRLIDKEGLSQEQCGDFMQVARTTVQQIYSSARKKLANVLVDGLPLRIEGGTISSATEETEPADTTVATNRNFTNSTQNRKENIP